MASLGDGAPLVDLQAAMAQGGRESFSPPSDAAAAEDNEGEKDSRPLSRSIRAVGRFIQQYPVIACSVAAVVVAGLIGVLALAPPPGLWPRPAGGGVVDPVFVARLSNTHKAEFAIGQLGSVPGAHLQAGHRYELTAGFAEIQFHRGASVILEGPAEFFITGDNRGRLAYGKLAAEAPPSARGFQIDTREGRVVDLGTAFGIDAPRAGPFAIHCFRGSISFEPDGKPPILLAAGQAIARSDAAQELEHERADIARFVANLRLHVGPRTGERGMIAIIGVLVSLLLPAVQSAREATRMAQCKNNLKQLGMGAKNHVTIHGHYPSSGWGYKWIGDPNRGFGRSQPGGWTYNTLPFIEKQNEHDIGLGMTGAALKTELVKLQQATVSTFLCPSRRRSKIYPSVSWYPEAHNTDFPTSGTAKTDYAGNGGENIQTWGGPPAGTTVAPNPLSDSAYAWVMNHTGVTHALSEVQPAHIRDGESGTYWAGEKQLTPDHYTTGSNGADNGSLYQGHDWDNLRWGHYVEDSSGNVISASPPLRDQAGVDCWRCFGSAHSSGVNFVMCDGSVHTINYSIDPDVHRRLSNCSDGQPVSVGSL